MKGYYFMKQDLFESLVEVIATLRGENGCPWDREQTHTSLKSTLIEETYEAVEAIDSGDSSKLEEELGDLLLNVMLQAQIAAENEDFSIYDVIQTLTEKLIRRHPHVFGNVQVDNAEDVVKNWEAIKSQEAGYEDRKSILDGIPNALPSLLRGQKIQKRVARVGFDWDNITDVIDKIDEELAEVKESLKGNEINAIENEIGDLLFSIVNLCRFLDLQAEESLRKTNRKFINRFKRMENVLEKQGKSISDQTLAELDEIWEAVKKDE